MNYKILIVVSLVMIIVGGIFSVSMRSYIHTYDTEWEGILSDEKKQNKSNKIFLIGSSGIYPIDALQINQYFDKTQKDFEIYNLADVADNPKKRLDSIENILKNKPTIVIFGLGMLEFEKNVCVIDEGSINNFNMIANCVLAVYFLLTKISISRHSRIQLPTYSFFSRRIRCRRQKYSWTQSRKNI